MGEAKVLGDASTTSIPDACQNRDSIDPFLKEGVLHESAYSAAHDSAALQRLSEEDIVELDEERKAAMVNNLLVVLTSEHESQPILNTGSLY